MMIKITVVLTTLFLAMTSINADNIRGLQGGRGGGGPPPGGGRPGGGPPEGGRPGGGPPGGGRPNMPPFGIDESELVDLACVSDPENEPVCALRNGEPGNWLCRTIVEPDTLDSESWSTCGNATRALPELDECGCCDGVCPVQCTCGCPLEDVVDAGFLVAYTKPSGEAGIEKCLAPEIAISLIAKPGGRFQCVTECPV
jgi:hypothetical protein